MKSAGFIHHEDGLRRVLDIVNMSHCVVYVRLKGELFQRNRSIILFPSEKVLIPGMKPTGKAYALPVISKRAEEIKESVSAP